MAYGLLDQPGQMIGHPRKTAGYKTGPQGHGHGYRVKGGGGHPLGLDLGDLAFIGRRAGLSLGQGVDLVIMNQQGQIDVPTDGG